MLPFSGEDEDFKVSGYTSLPELTRSNRNYLSIFINGRPIRNMAIAKAITLGYGSNINGGTIPLITSLFRLKWTCNSVDVNVHPTKQEVANQ